jgi:2-keto-3-deoxy-L-rhamnonate aldolase RhmA
MAAEGKAYFAFGIKFINGGEVDPIAKRCRYNSLFIDLEHTTFTIRDAGLLCVTDTSAGITLFARVPHGCGIGFMQKVLDGGAMGIIVPHIHTVGTFWIYALTW